MNIYPHPSISSPFCFPFIYCTFSTLLDNNTTDKKKQGHGANKRSNKSHFLCTTQNTIHLCTCNVQ